MKTLIRFLFVCVLPLTAFGATPSFKSFDTNDFTVLPSISNPSTIRSKGSSGTNVFNTIITTNLFVDTLVVTNVYAVSVTIQGTNVATVGDLLWTNKAGVLQPIDLALQPMIDKGLLVGTNSLSNYGSLGGEALVAYSDTSLGDPDFRSIELAVTLDPTFSASSGTAALRTRTNSSSLEIGGTLSGAQSSISLNNDFGNGIQALTMTVSGVGRSGLEPTQADGSAAYRFDTSLAHTTGNLLEVANNSTNMLSVNFGGGLVFGPGDTNVLSRSGKSLYYTLTGTGPEFSLIDTNGMQTTFGLNSSGDGFVASDTSTTLRLLSSTGGVMVFGTAFVPYVDETEDLGNTNTSSWWRDLAMKGTATISGYESGTNYSRMYVSHGATNNQIVFNSVSAGDAGDLPSGFNFNIGGTNIVKIGNRPGNGRDISFSPSGVSTMDISPSLARVTKTVGTANPLGSYGFISHTTANATSGAQENSPAFSMRGAGYSTNLAASETVYMGNYLVPSSGGAHPKGRVRYSYSIGISGDPGTSGDLFEIHTDGPVKIPTITKVQKTAIVPEEGMLVNQSDNTPGLRVYVNGAWVMISTVADP